MTELCLECGSHELKRNDYAIRATGAEQPEGQPATLSETHCLNCGWVNLSRG